MAYHLGRILEFDFGFKAIAVRVGDETPSHDLGRYDLRMPLIECSAMESEISAADILIANPSMSYRQFGWRLPGLKICYVQGFTTFPLLDLRFNHYVSVSKFVQKFLTTVYGLKTRVINPFVGIERSPDAQDWQKRPPNWVLPSIKGGDHASELSFLRLKEIMNQRAPHILFAEPISGGGTPQADLLSRIGQFRYFATLSPAEGFGLLALEAMAMGSTLIGYDGFGGRQYMNPGGNCAVAAYPDIEKVADLLIMATSDPQRSAKMARRGQQTAKHYSYAAFRRSWISEFDKLIGVRPLLRNEARPVE